VTADISTWPHCLDPQERTWVNNVSATDRLLLIEQMKRAGVPIDPTFEAQAHADEDEDAAIVRRTAIPTIHVPTDQYNAVEPA
jgi:hypothetical protein